MGLGFRGTRPSIIFETMASSRMLNGRRWKQRLKLKAGLRSIESRTTQLISASHAKLSLRKESPKPSAIGRRIRIPARTRHGGRLQGRVWLIGYFRSSTSLSKQYESDSRKFSATSPLSK